MTYASTAIARRILEIANGEDRSLTPLELLKLTYLSHGWHLAFLGQPLISEDVQAWQYGPAYPELYHATKQYRASPVQEVPERGIEMFGRQKVDPQTDKLLRSVFNTYKKFNGVQLSALTHQPGTPWEEAWSKSRNAAIPDEVIKRHFDELREKRAA
ncbi:Panacea domain-containing protein [Ruegeria sp. HKCCA5929]|uniref:Panacea domain-containing protein n=1 Tax=Ruegeria sp. HKCCA5929 TaxID=2682988 RepID=UPI0014892F5C|nr:type II toxin-antitoxin system antitoxin SocA domain-containing protein [Ruegeria sp. HKCCA5929]